MRTAMLEIPTPPEKPVLANPSPVQQVRVTWKVLTPGTIPEGEDCVFFGLTSKNYENLAINQAELLRFITEAMFRLNYYRGDSASQPTVSDTEKETD